MMNIHELLEIVVKRQASDLHLVVGYPPVLRIGEELVNLLGDSLSAENTQTAILSILTPEQKELFLANHELDFSLSLPFSRFRVNAYFQRGAMAASFRAIPLKIKTIEELGLPEVCHSFARLKQGLVLITGPSVQGKSTTLAAILDEINREKACHIISIEDPIEYVYPKRKALISQREMKLDTYSWAVALRSVLREDPNVVLIGEMRDQETIDAALTTAETGHLVFTTLHTNSAAQAIDRIVDVFSADEQNQARLQLSLTLEGIFCQRLIPAISRERIPAYEILLKTPAVANTIREGKSHLIDNIIQTSGDIGMISFEGCLVDLLLAGKISLEVAQSYTLRPVEFLRMWKNRK